MMRGPSAPLRLPADGQVTRVGSSATHEYLPRGSNGAQGFGGLAPDYSGGFGVLAPNYNGRLGGSAAGYNGGFGGVASNDNGGLGGLAPDSMMYVPAQFLPGLAPW